MEIKKLEQQKTISGNKINKQIGVTLNASQPKISDQYTPAPDFQKYITDLYKKADKSKIKKTKYLTITEPHKVGDKKEFWTWDLGVMPPGFKKINTTCRAVGDNSYIFIDDKAWGTNVTEKDLEQIQTTFNKQTPPKSIDPKKGIYSIDTDSFGEPPNMDGDPKINLLITNFDQFQGTGFDGYFNPFDQMDDETAWKEFQQHSNETEILYLNSASKTTPIASDYMKAVVAHEFEHLITFNYDPEETSWLNESCGEAAMTLCGYYTDKNHVKNYAEHPGTVLVSDQYVNYGACLLWGTYLFEQMGKGFFKPLTQNKKQGVESINEVLKEVGSKHNFETLFSNWVAANYASSKGVKNLDFHYKFMDIPPMKLSATLSPSKTEHSDTLKYTGVNYIAIENSPTGTGSLSITGNIDAGKNSPTETFGIGAELLYFDGDNVTVEKLPTNGSSVTVDTSRQPVLAVYGLSEKAPASYTVKANMI